MTDAVKSSALVIAAPWVGVLFCLGFVVGPCLFAVAAVEGGPVPNSGLHQAPTAVSLVVLAAALACGACGEITAFCLSAGAPDGATLTLVATPTGYRCSWVRDSLPRDPSPSPKGR